MVNLMPHCHVSILIGQSWSVIERLQMSVLRMLSAYRGIHFQSRHSSQPLLPTAKCICTEHLSFPRRPVLALPCRLTTFPFSGTPVLLGSFTPILQAWAPVLICGLLAPGPPGFLLSGPPTNYSLSKDRTVNSPQYLQDWELMMVIVIYNHYMIDLYI